MTTSEFIKELQELVKQRPDLSDKEIVAVDDNGLVAGYGILLSYINEHHTIGKLR